MYCVNLFCLLHIIRISILEAFGHLPCADIKFGEKYDELDRKRKRVRVLLLRELALKLFMIDYPEESESERYDRRNKLFEIAYPASERKRDAHIYKLFKKANPERASKIEAELKAMTDLIATERKAAREREEAFTHLPFADHK